MTVDLKVLGMRFKQLRTSKGLSQQNVADYFGVKAQEVSLWERGKRDIKTTTIVKLANFYNVSCDYLLTGVEYQNKDNSNNTIKADFKGDVIMSEVKNKTEKQIEFLKTHLEKINTIVGALTGIPSWLRVETKGEKFVTLVDDSKDLMNYCGIMSKCFRKVRLRSFNTHWDTADNEDIEEACICLHFDYELKDGGSNGFELCTLQVDKCGMIKLLR